MSRYAITGPARRDLDDAADYLEFEYGRRDLAIKFLRSMNATFEKLARHPGLGRLRPEIPRNPQSFAARNYTIFYAQTAAGIEILRVLHQRRDIDAAFEEGE
ncbi:MAG TPA: type II toxin-antitoxin system RelE/ParE family toxin [Longimicrobium sp.]|nr:type II toxin-antitoxin system RelE/ParE family toxin [Longimicrobium sp.]